MKNAAPPREKPRLFCLTSGKGGVGKTSLAVNLAFALADSDRRVLIVDGDLGLANVDVLLGLPVQATIRDILDCQGDPLDTVVYLSPNLGILPAASGVPELAILGPEEQAELAQVLSAIARHFHYVIVDTAAGIGPAVLWFNTMVDHILVVATPDPTSMTDAYALIKVLSQQYGRHLFHILVNQVQNDQEARQTFNTLSQVARKFLQVSLQYLGAVPLEAAVRVAIREQVPFLRLSPRGRASQAVRALAARLHHLQSKRTANHARVVAASPV